jgi:hypothetical protein
MKITPNTPLKELDGNQVHAWVTNSEGAVPILKIEGKSYVEIVEKVTTLGGEICKALLTPKDEKDPLKLLEMGRLAQRLYGQDAITVTVEEASLIQSACAKAAGERIISILAYTQIHEMVEGKKAD